MLISAKTTRRTSIFFSPKEAQLLFRQLQKLSARNIAALKCESRKTKCWVPWNPPLMQLSVNTLESRWDLPLMGPEPNLGLGLPTNQVAPVVPERRSSSAPTTPQPGVQLQRPSFPQTNPSVRLLYQTVYSFSQFSFIFHFNKFVHK